MRTLLAVMAILCMALASPAGRAHGQAIAPAPEVRLTGFIDTITTWTKNLQDTIFTRSGDTEWYTRNRGRFDIVGQLGGAKAVFGFEIDSVWGQVSGGDNNLASGGIFAQRFGATSAFDINTDTQGSLEVKWLYTEFPLPLAPFPVIVRLGAQPFLSPYKLGAYATGDFAGANIDAIIARNLRAHFLHLRRHRGEPHRRPPQPGLRSRRRLGDDRERGDRTAAGARDPALYSFSWPALRQLGDPGDVRRDRDQSVSPITFTRANSAVPSGSARSRIATTIGIDARWRSGPFLARSDRLLPVGTRDSDNPFRPASSSAKDRVTEARLDAWFVDVIGGWRMGPPLLEGRYMYTTGNRPKDQLNRDVNYYQPLDTDTSYWSGGWGEIYSLGIDYFQGNLRGMGATIGHDRYGRQQFALRAIYSVTSDLDLRGVVSPAWTARSLDTDGQPIFVPFQAGASTACNTAATGKGAGCNGDASFIGTEVALGLTWRFAPGLVFDVAGAVLFAGSALDASEIRNGVLTKMHAKDAYLVSSRIRYSF
jgi:hypothetical protein